MDFVHDETFDGKQICCLNIVDNWSRECVGIHVVRLIKEDDIVKVMKGFIRTPKRIKVNNGSEFISKVLDKCTYQYYQKHEEAQIF